MQILLRCNDFSIIVIKKYCIIDDTFILQFEGNYLFSVLLWIYSEMLVNNL